MGIQPAVKKETLRVAAFTLAGTAVMFAVFAIGHRIWPEYVPFDYRVILGGLAGSAVAVLNFFLMGLTVQKIASQTDEEKARLIMKSSYSRRLLMQLLWIILAIVVPVFQFAAGIAPLFFPSLGIKLRGILMALSGKNPSSKGGESG